MPTFPIVRIFKRHTYRLLAMLLGIIAISSFFPLMSLASSTPTSSTSSRIVLTNGVYNLEDAFNQWHIYSPRGFAKGTMAPVPSPFHNRTAIQLAITHRQSYYNEHAYRDLPPADKATVFRLTVSFYLTNDHPAQAIEFHMNKWVNNTRWKFAVQWQSIPDGSRQEGSINSWRIWGEQGWYNIGASQNLAANTWHTLHLTGEIVNGKAHYLSFDCDNMSTNLNKWIFKPMKAQKGDKLAVAIQLDGTPHLTPYPLDVDGISLEWK